MKKKNVYAIIILVLMGITGTGKAQDMVPKKCYLHLTGSISNEYPIEMNLVRINDTIYGDYLFVQPGRIPFGGENTGKGIPVYGRMGRDNGFTLKELDTPRGNLFKGKFVSSQVLSGTFENAEGGKPLPFEVREKYPEGSIAMDVYYRKASMPLVKKPGSPVAALQLGMLLPGESANPLISDTLIRLMLEKFTVKQVRIAQPEKLLDGMRQVYFENYLSTNEGIYNAAMASGFNWQSLKFLHILMNSSYILSFYIDHYAFTGGAHGIQTRQFTVVNLWTGKEVELKNIFKENTEAQLSSILSDKIHGIYHIPTTQSLKDAGFYNDTVRPAENFYITHEGIGFYYNQYDIAPYASGCIDVFIPFRELKALLVEGGVLRQLSR
jgi:hypothetical protein